MSTVQADWEEGWQAFLRLRARPAAHPKTMGGGIPATLSRGLSVDRQVTSLTWFAQFAHNLSEWQSYLLPPDHGQRQNPRL